MRICTEIPLQGFPPSRLNFLYEFRLSSQAFLKKGGSFLGWEASGEYYQRRLAG